MMHLFIHTYGRSAQQTTLSFLTSVPKEHISLVIQKRETAAYDHWRRFGYEVLVLPDRIRMLSPTRQWIMDHARERGFEKACLLDDDLRFNVRGLPSHNVKATDFTLWVATPEQTLEGLNLLDQWLDEGWTHVSMSAREGNNRIVKEFTEVGRAMRLLAYRVDDFHRYGARFDRIDCKQDLDVTLQLFRAGRPNRISWRYATGQATGSGARGGCATYRDAAMLERCAYELADLHPGFVKVVEKDTKTSFGGGTRTDVIVQWRKAYESSQRKVAA